MSDDTTQAFLNMRRIDPDLDADNKRFQAAMDEDQSTGWYEQTKKSVAGMAGVDNLDEGPGRVLNWAMNLPKNIGIGAYRALVNTVDTAVDFERQWLEGTINDASGQKDASGKAKKVISLPPLSESHPELMQSVYGLADEWTANNKTEDDLTQGVAQFTLPFLTWMRAFNGMGAVTKAVTAEAVTAGSAYQPHEARMADLVNMGRELDGKFGNLLRSVSPDGSATNAYINYMTEREGEGEWEGRFKNSIDSLVATAGLGAFIGAAGITYKTTRKALMEQSAKPATAGAK